MTTTSQSDIKRYPCSSCGAELEFNTEQAQLKCNYCGYQEVISSDRVVEEKCFNEQLNSDRIKLKTLSETALEVSCSDCGANIIFEPPQVAGNCPFCAANIVTQPKLAEPIITPEAVIPFTIGRKKVSKNLQQWLSKHWFVPNELKKLAQLEKIQGVYLPFWTYDADTATYYRGERGITECDEDEDGSSSNCTTNWSPVSGQVVRFFDDILVSGTNLIERDRLGKLEPWHLQESLKPYNPSYLAGFEAQRSQIDLEDGFEIAKNIMACQIREDVEKDIGGDEQRIHHLSTSYNATTFKHILLPVWLTSYRYRNKQYQVIINGYTGKIKGDRPLSNFKIVCTVLACIALVGLIIFLCSK